MQRPHISAYISALAISFLLLLPTRALGQPKRPAVTHRADTTALFRGIAVSYDLLGTGQLLLSDYGQYEAALRINLKDRYFPIIELGIGKADAEDESTRITYKTQAPYGRIGIDFNMLKNKHDIYRLYAGGRYAYTSYKFDISSPGVIDPNYGGMAPYEAHDVEGNMHWLELAFGVDAKIWGPVHLGWSVRYKRRLFHREGDVGDAWYVPGYGRNGGSRIGGTVNLIFDL